MSFLKNTCFLNNMCAETTLRVFAIRLVLLILCEVEPRALTPLFWNGAGAHGLGKISGVLTKIGKLDIVLMYDVYIARLIPIIKLTLVYYEKRERKKQVFLYSMK